MSANKSLDNNGVVLVDFTGTLDGFKHLSGFGPEFVELVRTSSPPEMIVLIDSCVCKCGNNVCLATDHINLSGNNPLVGPNHPVGERFPVVQDTYVQDCLSQVPRVVVAGLANGVVPDAQDQAAIKAAGASCCCYNLVPATLIAAHAKAQVIGLVCKKGSKLSQSIVDEIKAYVGGKQ